MCAVRLAGNAAAAPPPPSPSRAAAAVARTFYSSHAAHQCETDDKNGPRATLGRWGRRAGRQAGRKKEPGWMDARWVWQMKEFLTFAAGCPGY